MLAMAAYCVLGIPTMANQTPTPSPSEMIPVLARYQADVGSLTRFYNVPNSPTRSERFRKLYAGWQKTLDGMDFGKLSRDGKVDWVLFRRLLEKNVRDLDTQAKQFKEAEPLLPFAQDIIELSESRQRMEKLDPAKAAARLNAMRRALEGAQKEIETKHQKSPYKRTTANRAADLALSFKQTLAGWYRFYNGYLPEFDWWVDEPYKAFDTALQSYSNFLKEKIVGIKADDKTTIIGNPIGSDALKIEFESELIPYTAEELLEVANNEFAWCDAEMLKASQDMGFGEDWKKALEKVKQDYVEPGKQPELIRELALEAIEFVEKRDLLTVPDLAKETWRMDMMSAEAQLRNPFFLGGEVIQVSYPTDGMSHEAKMMSMRGNNRHFARATVQHELIPGHHMQGFMTDRYQPQREMFSTPFWIEGWALYWEMLLWDKGFPKTPENRVGMLFWRMHRCARIIFSLSFHLEKWTPDQCVKFLIDRVGFEPDNASAEVRRSFMGGYGPLYQCAYMLGGLQFRALHRQLVDSKKMTDRQFHDTILQSGAMPVAMLRAILTNADVKRDFNPGWRFYDEK
ncbi:MAG: DUF885 family protein [Armatimonadetes bacterium]|nr:DUF885 family protein [Armatimonadota bacterium]